MVPFLKLDNSIHTMSLVAYSAFLLTGFLLGVGATLLYIQYSMYSQVGEIEKQMEAMADIQEGLDLEPENIQDAEASEKEEKE